MRKTEKSKLYDNFRAIDEELPSQNCVHVIDGGYLLHKCVWPQKQNFDAILNRYVSYVKK